MGVKQEGIEVQEEAVKVNGSIKGPKRSKRVN